MENLESPFPEGYSYLQVESTPEKDIFRIKEVTSGGEADEWMRKLCNETKTTWRVSRTYPKVGNRNFYYRKDYKCQHSTDKRATGAGPSKNTNCPARLNIIIRSCRKTSKARDAKILRQYPTEIVLQKAHNHAIEGVESLRCRDMSNETRQKLLELFKKGHSPASALNYLNLELMCKYPDNYYKLASDNSYLPSSSIVCKLFKKEANENGLYTGRKLLADLEELVEKYKRTNDGKTVFQKTTDGSHCYCVIITSFMLRCHQEVQQSSKLVLLDVSGSSHKTRYKSFIFMSPTTVGGLPLGVIITDCEKEYVFTKALLCYKELLTNAGFYYAGYPKIFLANNAMKERGCLQTAFPESSILLNQCHLLKTMWSRLSFKKNNINVHHRKKLYVLFKQVVNSFQHKEAESNSLDFISEVELLGYPKLKEHFMWLWNIKEEWITCFRKEAMKDFSKLKWKDDSSLFKKVMNIQLNPEEHLQFQKLVERSSSNPDIIVPAVRKTLMNGKNCASTFDGLIPGLSSFGAFNTGIKSANQTAAKNLTKRSCKILLAAEYSHAKRKMKVIDGKKRILEQTCVSFHDYKRFKKLLKSDETSVDSLDQLVLNDRTLTNYFIKESFESNLLRIPGSDHIRTITVDELANLEMEMDDESQFIIVVP